MEQRHYVSNKNETVRMFESDFMELFSHLHPVTPLVLYLPVVGYMLYVALWQRKLSILLVAGLVLLGVLAWTLFEYIHASLRISPRTEEPLGGNGCTLLCTACIMTIPMMPSGW